MCVNLLLRSELAAFLWWRQLILCPVQELLLKQDCLVVLCQPAEYCPIRTSLALPVNENTHRHTKIINVIWSILLLRWCMNTQILWCGCVYLCIHVLYIVISRIACPSTQIELPITKIQYKILWTVIYLIGYFTLVGCLSIRNKSN